jgi:hypothetical protein
MEAAHHHWAMRYNKVFAIENQLIVVKIQTQSVLLINVCSRVKLVFRWVYVCFSSLFMVDQIKLIAPAQQAAGLSAVFGEIFF